MSVLTRFGSLSFLLLAIGCRQPDLAATNVRGVPFGGPYVPTGPSDTSLTVDSSSLDQLRQALTNFAPVVTLNVNDCTCILDDASKQTCEQQRSRRSAPRSVCMHITYTRDPASTPTLIQNLVAGNSGSLRFFSDFGIPVQIDELTQLEPFNPLGRFGLEYQIDLTIDPSRPVEIAQHSKPDPGDGRQPTGPLIPGVWIPLTIAPANKPFYGATSCLCNLDGPAPGSAAGCREVCGRFGNLCDVQILVKIKKLDLYLGFTPRVIPDLDPTKQVEWTPSLFPGAPDFHRNKMPDYQLTITGLNTSSEPVGGNITKLANSTRDVAVGAILDCREADVLFLAYKAIIDPTFNCAEFGPATDPQVISLLEEALQFGVSVEVVKRVTGDLQAGIGSALEMRLKPLFGFSVAPPGTAIPFSPSGSVCTDRSLSTSLRHVRA